MMELKDYIEIGLTATMVFATIVYVLFTHKLVKESRKLREQSLEAHIICYLVSAENSPSLVSLIIENVGKGVATNIRGEVIRDIAFANRPLEEIGFFSKPLEYFSSGNKVKYFIGTIAKDYDERIADYFEFELTYNDQLKKDKTKTFKIEFNDIRGFSTVTPPDTHIGMIAYRLEKIEKLIERGSK